METYQRVIAPKGQLKERGLKEVWKAPKYLAGLIDGEGSFSALIIEVRPRTWYLQFSFTMGLLATEEWMNIANHFAETYGGRADFRNGKRYYYLDITRADKLLKFLDDYIPLLTIRRGDAEALRKALLDYTAIVDKAKTTKEEWEEWLKARKLR